MRNVKLFFIFFTIISPLFLIPLSPAFASNVCSANNVCYEYQSTCLANCPTGSCASSSCTPTVMGESGGNQSSPGLENGITTKEQLLTVLNNILNYVYTVFFIIAAMFILFAAYSFLTAAGDEEKVRNAKNRLLYAVIAIVIALVSIGASGLIAKLISLGGTAAGGGSLPIGSTCTTGAVCAPGLQCFYARGTDPTGTCQPSNNNSAFGPGSFGSDCSLNPSIWSGDLIWGSQGTCEFPGQ